MQRAAIVLAVCYVIYADVQPPLLFSVSTFASSMQNYESVSCGGRHTCAIRRATTKKMECFGLNDQGQTNIPFAEGWTQVSSGWRHTCGLDVSGNLQCWGDSSFGQSNVPSNLTRPIAVAAGKTHTCAINGDNSLACWGDASLDKLDAPAGYNWAALCVAASHACAVSTNGSIACWGYNGLGRAAVPRQLSATKFVGVNCKGSHTCAIAADQTVSCWGHNGHGQTTVPITSQTGQWFSITTGSYGTCGVRVLVQSEISCDPTATTPVPPLANTVCWGDSSYGQGNVPYRPDGWKTREACNTLQWAVVDQGGYHTCGITVDDSSTDEPLNLLQCWGLADDGQLILVDGWANRLSPTTSIQLVAIGIVVSVMWW